jgi:phosphohistidine phosphatase SixA
MYGASLNMLLTLAGDAFSYSERLLMVGHNPGVEVMLIKLLQKNQVDSQLKMAPGTLAIIDFPNEFKREARNGKLLNLVRKEDVPDD